MIAMSAHPPVPPDRVRPLNPQPLRSDGSWVVYWMVAFRRVRFNFALQHAANLAREHDVPLIIFDALRCDYPFASDRLHRFIIEGMRDNARALAEKPALHYPYVEPARSAGSGLLERLADDACAVVTDDFPAFFLPRMVTTVGQRLEVACHAVDSNGLLPLTASDRAYPTAYAFRRFVQKTLPGHLDSMPSEDPLAEIPSPPPQLPATITDRWPPANLPKLLDDNGLAQLPIDHSVPPAPLAGGTHAAQERLEQFLQTRLELYNEARNQPERSVTSELSPYLHFGHISAHEVFLQLVTHQRWSPDDLSGTANGRREGWWGADAPTEAFLDQLITWRELGFNVCHHRPDDYFRYESLPPWARQTLAEHADDPRDHLYDLESFTAATTHDPLWNAAQRQLLSDGTIHNYLRMLWGKKILEWTRSPQEALDIMLELNNRYALDGRDPNSYSGIFWVLGRHDRAWGPERPIFGKIRYMSSANTARKVRVRGYIERFGD